MAVDEAQPWDGCDRFLNDVNPDGFHLFALVNLGCNEFWKLF